MHRFTEGRDEGVQAAAQWRLVVHGRRCAGVVGDSFGVCRRGRHSAGRATRSRRQVRRGVRPARTVRGRIQGQSTIRLPVRSRRARDEPSRKGEGAFRAKPRRQTRIHRGASCARSCLLCAPDVREGQDRIRDRASVRQPPARPVVAGADVAQAAQQYEEGRRVVGFGYLETGIGNYRINDTVATASGERNDTFYNARAGGGLNCSGQRRVARWDARLPLPVLR